MRRTIACWIVMMLALPALGAREPFRHFTTSDGLAQDSVTSIASDADGFLWIGTLGGLSRFDGEGFLTFGSADGLEGSAVHDIAIGVEGTFWVATEAGLFAFRPSDVPKEGRLFKRIAIEDLPDDDVAYRLLADRDGSLWVGTLTSLLHMRHDNGALRGSAIDLDLTSRVQALAQDPAGAVWVGTHVDGVFRISRDGRVDRIPPSITGADFVRGFRFDTEGSVWTAFFGGVAIFKPPLFPAREPYQSFGHEQGAPIDTKGFVDSGASSVLLGSTLGVTEFRRSQQTQRWFVARTIDRRSGLPGDNVERLALDSAGNIWVGLTSRGLAKRLVEGFTTLEDANGPGAIVVSLTNARDGSPLAISFVGSKAITVAQPERGASAPVHVNLPSDVRYTGWGATRKLLQSRDGTWWAGTGSGLFHYAGPVRTVERLASPPDSRFTVADGLAGNDVFSIHEDGMGRLWVSTTASGDNESSVVVRPPGARRFERLALTDLGTNALVRSFADGPEGSLWLSFLDGDVRRVQNGHVEAIDVPPDVSAHFSSLFFDRQGRIWLLGRGRIYWADAQAHRPLFHRYETRTDTSNAAFYCAVEDRHARLWLASSQGVYRIDPQTGAERRFTIDDGLVGNSLPLCSADGAGVLWFSDFAGLSRIDPDIEPASPLEPARLREVRIAGEAVPIPSVGGTMVGPLSVDSGRRTISIEYFAVHTASGPPPRFQYRLDGIDSKWSAVTRDRRVQYFGLPPGSYQFLVRTVDEQGNVHSTPAVASFRVRAPFWQHGWFLALSAALALGGMHVLYRVRVARVVALERVRTRIATDLHDDIGSSLSQIAILSQLARREIERRDAEPPASLARITEVSGELVDTLGDVVWAINPQRDRMSDLVHRMRRFASELFSDGDAVVRLELPSDEGDVPLDADVRRQVYLVFKEALHNARRHAGAARIDVVMRRGPKELLLTIRDDGRGFPEPGSSRGQGLASMRRRAEAIGADLEVRSIPGEGTEIVLRAGSARRARRGTS